MGAAADVPTPSPTSTLPANPPLDDAAPVAALADAEPCGLRPLQAGLIKALRLPLETHAQLHRSRRRRLARGAAARIATAARLCCCSTWRSRQRVGKWHLKSKRSMRVQRLMHHRHRQLRPCKRTAARTAAAEPVVRSCEAMLSSDTSTGTCCC